MGWNDEVEKSASEQAMLADLREAEVANVHGRECQVCQALGRMPESVKPGVLRALSGTIGQDKLASILTKNGYPTGWRAVARHRREGHQA